MGDGILAKLIEPVIAACLRSATIVGQFMRQGNGADNIELRTKLPVAADLEILLYAREIVMVLIA